MFVACNSENGSIENTGGDSGGSRKPITYTVSFVIDGEVAEEQKVAAGESFSKPTCSTEKEGYTFKGWTYEDGKSVNWTSPIDRKVSKDVTLIAKYAIDSYEIKFYYSDKQIGETQKVEYGKEFTLPQESEFIESDYIVFKGWKKEGEETVYTADDIEKTVKANEIYTAVAELKAYSLVELTGFKTEFSLYDIFTEGDGATVTIHFTDGSHYTLAANEYETVAPQDFAQEITVY